MGGETGGERRADRRLTSLVARGMEVVIFVIANTGWEEWEANGSLREIARLLPEDGRSRYARSILE